MKIQLIRDLKIGTATRTCAYSRKQLRQQRRAQVLSCLMRMGVHHTRRPSPSGSGREELSHLWSSGGATQRNNKKNASFCFCAPDLTQEASVGRTACNKKTPAPLSAISHSVAAAVIVAPNCAIAPVINFHSGAIRQTLDGLQQGSGPIHAKWVRGVNLRCLQRLGRFPSVSLSLSASDRLAEAQLRKANNIQRCCSLYCRSSPPHPPTRLCFTRFFLVPASPASSFFFFFCFQERPSRRCAEEIEHPTYFAARVRNFFFGGGGMFLAKCWFRLQSIADSLRGQLD